MTNTIRASSWISFLFGIVMILFVWCGEPAEISVLTKEDGVIENLSAIFYIVGFIFSFVAIFKNERKYLAVIWVILCFIFLGEEVSWFQRIFDYSVPFVQQMNAQNEFNLHNLYVLQREGGSLTNPSNWSIGLSLFLRPQNLFRLGFFGYFLIIPLLLYIPTFKKLVSDIGYKKPDNIFTFFLFIVFIFSFFAALFSPVDVKSALAETREMLYAFFIMQYIIVYIRNNDLAPEN